MACPRTACLVMRTQTARGTFRAAFSTTKPPLPSLRVNLHLPPRCTTAHSVFRSSQAQAVTPICRASSSQAAAPRPTDPISVSSDVLTWDRFFDLRRKRRLINLGSSVLTAFASLTLFTRLATQQDLDSWVAQVTGIDSFYVLIGAAIATAGGGWLCGPTAGNLIFRCWARVRGWRIGAVAEKEKSFYGRIRRYRADPSASSPQNPIPDYYGEKIRSVKDYRRWLKDQRAFNLKKNKSII